MVKQVNPHQERLREQEIQRAIVEHLAWRKAPGVFWHAIPNGGWRSPTEAAIMKGTGTRAGVLDMEFVVPPNGVAHYLEVKTETGHPTRAQLDCIAEITAAGGHAAIGHGLDSCLKILENWNVLRGKAS